MGYRDMRAAIEEIIGEKKTQETDEEILQAYHECKLTGIFIMKIKTYGVLSQWQRMFLCKKKG